MKTHFADIIWGGMTNSGEPVRACFIFEHKSWRPDRPVSPQLLRYSGSSMDADFDQKRPPALPVPIVIYHGEQPWQKEKMAELFPNVPLGFRRFVPEMDYIFINVSDLSDEQIEGLALMVLSKLLLTLKHGRDADFVAQNFGKMAFYSPILHQRELAENLFSLTTIYLVSISSLNLNNMNTAINEMPPLEQEQLNSWLYKTIVENQEKGWKKGREEGREEIVWNVIKKHPDWTNAQIADLIEVNIEMVAKIRAEYLANSKG